MLPASGIFQSQYTETQFGENVKIHSKNLLNKDIQTTAS